MGKYDPSNPDPRKVQRWERSPGSERKAAKLQQYRDREELAGETGKAKESEVSDAAAAMARQQAAAYQAKVREQGVGTAGKMTTGGEQTELLQTLEEEEKEKYAGEYGALKGEMDKVAFMRKQQLAATVRANFESDRAHKLAIASAIGGALIPGVGAAGAMLQDKG